MWQYYECGAVIVVGFFVTSAFIIYGHKMRLYVVSHPEPKFSSQTTEIVKDEGQLWHGQHTVQCKEETSGSHQWES